MTFIPTLVVVALCAGLWAIFRGEASAQGGGYVDDDSNANQFAADELDPANPNNLAVREDFEQMDSYCPDTFDNSSNSVDPDED